MQYMKTMLTMESLSMSLLSIAHTPQLPFCQKPGRGSALDLQLTGEELEEFIQTGLAVIQFSELHNSKVYTFFGGEM